MYPLRYIKEIDLMMITAFASNQCRRGSITWRSSFESSVSSTGGYAPVITYNLAPSSTATSSIQPSTPPPKRLADIASPIPGFSTTDYNHDGLRTYMDWLQDKYNDDDFDNAFNKLCAVRIGLDLVANISEEMLIN
jgi:hypothetical protein